MFPLTYHVPCQLEFRELGALQSCILISLFKYENIVIHDLARSFSFHMLNSIDILSNLSLFYTFTCILNVNKYTAVT